MPKLQAQKAPVKGFVGNAGLAENLHSFLKCFVVRAPDSLVPCHFA